MKQSNVSLILPTALMLAVLTVFTACSNSAVTDSGNLTPADSYNAATGEGRVNGVKFTMKSVDAVTNKSIGHGDDQDNKPHNVSLSAYLIGETQVTQELWEKVMGSNPSWFNGTYNKVPVGTEVQAKRPVEQVSWFDCIVFCNELTKKVNNGSDKECVYTVGGHTYGAADAAEEKEPLMDMSRKGFRLPTEAEWEWAAKGGKEDRWAGTDKTETLADYAWYDANSSYKTHQVKLKQPNGYGLYDMSGNVWEWCWDWHGSLDKPVPKDYTGAAFGIYRVKRGGSWGDQVQFTACAYRGDDTMPNDRDCANLGLRVVCRP